MKQFNSSFTEASSATTLYSFPLAPSSLLVNRINATGYSLSWVDNAFNETSYHIESGLSGLNNFIEISSPSSNTIAYTGGYLTASDSWTTKYSGLFRSVYTSESGNIVYLASTTGIIRSLNYGNDWSLIKGGSFNEAKCSTDGRILVVRSGSLSGCVFDQTGTNFLRSYVCTGGFDISSGGDVIYSISGNSVRRSTDTGATFFATAVTSPSAINCACSRNANVLVVIRGDGNAEYYRNSGDINYASTSNTDYESLKLTNIASVGSFNGMLVSTGENQLTYVSQNTPLEPAHISFFANANWKDVCFADDGSLSAAIEDVGGLWVSNNTGQSYSSVIAGSKTWLSLNCSSGGGHIYAISSGEIGNSGVLYTNNSNYGFRVRANNQRGYSSYSNTGYL